MTTTVHVTRVFGRDVYGHLTDHCDPSGCSGDELYFAGIDGAEVRRGDLVESVTLVTDRPAGSARQTYLPIDQGRIPAGVRFDVPGPYQGQIVEHAFGGFGRYEHGDGDQYMRITDRSLSVDHPFRVIYYKRVP